MVNNDSIYNAPGTGGTAAPWSTMLEESHGLDIAATLPAKAGIPYMGEHPFFGAPNQKSKIKNQKSVFAFSLIEVMVVVALLGVIILGLVAMFHQTQRALVSSSTQSDVLESGRAIAEILASDLQKMAPCNSTNTNAWNFYAALEYQNGNPAYLIQPLLAPGDARTNVMETFFFVSVTNQHWFATGYTLDRPDLGVATLYRTNFDLTYGFTNRPAPPGVGVPVSGTLAIPYAFRDFINLANAAGANKTVPSNFSRIADGIIDLRVRAYGANGVLIPLMNPRPRSVVPSYSTLGLSGQYNIAAAYDNTITGDYDYSFNSNAVPSAIEIELGVLEPRSLTRFYGLTNTPSAAIAWLQKTNRAGQVHVFRQRIPIRNVDPTAYQ